MLEDYSDWEFKRFCHLFWIDFIEEDHDGFKGLFNT